MTDGPEEKGKLRRDLLEIRDSLSRQETEEAAEDICARLRHLPEYLTCDCVLAYVPTRSELDICGFLEQALADKKALFLPVVQGKRMEFYQISRPGELRPGAYGILEPPGDRPFRPEDYRDILWILPGVGYDREGYRMGYGGGYYDRYMADHPDLVKRSLAVGYQAQLVDRLPRERTDIKPGRILLV